MTVVAQQPRVRSLGVGLLVLGAAALVVLAGAAGWLLVQQPDRKVVTYTTASAMAERAGCQDTFAGASLGSALDAGSCRTRAGLKLQFRIYPSGPEASAWLDGASAQLRQDTPSGSALGVDWAVLVTGGTESATASLAEALEQSQA